MFRFIFLFRRCCAAFQICLLLFPCAVRAEETATLLNEPEMPPELSTESAPLEQQDFAPEESNEATPGNESAAPFEAIPDLKNSISDFTQLVINEVDLEVEFIELWNTGMESIDLSTLQFSEIVGSAEARHPFSEFTSEVTLAPQGFLLLSMSRKLNNTGETIKLYAAPDASVPFQELVIPATQGGKSYARQSTGNFSWGVPTPGTFNFTLTPPELPEIPVEPPITPVPSLPENSSYTALVLNEIDLEAEFIELWNSGVGELDLRDFEFSELSGNDESRHPLRNFSTQTTLASGEFLLIPLSRILNNTGENIRIYIHSEVQLPLITLQVPAVQNGKSYARTPEGEYQWVTPTPGTANLFPEAPISQPEPPHPASDFSALHLNEVDPESEFLEFWNSGPDVLNLSSLEFSELSGTREMRHRLSDFTLQLQLEGNAYLTVSLSRLINNSGDQIRLYADATASQPFFELAIPELQAGKTYSRKDDGSYAWTMPSPGGKNIFLPDPVPETPLPVPSTADFAGLILNEVDLEAEFIELWNHGETALDLRTLEFSELSGGNEVRHPFADATSEATLLPGGFAVLSLSNKLNNSGETIRIYLHTANALPFTELEVPASKAGASFARDTLGIFQWTSLPTPGAENQIQALPSSGKAPAGATLKTTADFFEAAIFADGLAAAELTLQVSEIAFKNSKHDRIELFCAVCGTAETPLDLKGFRLFDDKVFFEFPENTWVKSGDFIVLQLKSESEGALKTDFGWEFHIAHPGLTATDETLVLVDAFGTIEDGVCWGNWNADFSSGEDDDMAQMITQNAWNSGEKRSDFQCFPSAGLSTKMAIARQNGIDTNTAEDFFPTLEQSFGRINPNSPLSGKTVDLRLERLIFLPKSQALLTVRNIGDASASLAHFTLKNAQKTVLTFADESIAPQAQKTFPLKLPTENLFLTLNDAWGIAEDFWCLNPPEGEFLNEAGAELLQEMHRMGKWSGREFESCLEVSIPENMQLSHEQFSGPAGKADFNISPLESRAMGEAPELLVSRVMPNPKGADESQEWLEITADIDIPDLSAWRLFIGEHLVTLPARELAAGESLRIFAGAETFDTLPNKTGKLRLLAPNGIFYTLEWEKAKDDAVLRIADGALLWDIPAKPPKTAKTSQSEEIEAEQRRIYGDEIEVELISVLPNPKGKDAGQEAITLRNISGYEGTLRFWSIKNDKKILKLPFIFFSAGEEKTLLGKEFVPNLKNTDGILQLIDASGIVREELTWMKARDNELFGKNIISGLPKKKKAVKKSKKEAATSKKKAEEVMINGKLLYFSAISIVIELSDGATQEYFFAAKNQQQLFLLQKMLHIGQEVSFIVDKDGKISHFTWNQSAYSSISFKESTSVGNTFPALTALFLVSSAGSSFLGLRKKRLLRPPKADSQ